jgi:hypothetical protein
MQALSHFATETRNIPELGMPRTRVGGSKRFKKFLDCIKSSHLDRSIRRFKAEATALNGSIIDEVRPSIYFGASKAVNNWIGNVDLRLFYQELRHIHHSNIRRGREASEGHFNGYPPSRPDGWQRMVR